MQQLEREPPRRHQGGSANCPDRQTNKSFQSFYTTGSLTASICASRAPAGRCGDKAGRRGREVLDGAKACRCSGPDDGFAVSQTSDGNLALNVAQHEGIPSASSSSRREERGRTHRCRQALKLFADALLAVLADLKQMHAKAGERQQCSNATPLQKQLVAARRFSRELLHKLCAT